MDCDMCGREQAVLKVVVEGSLLNLCDGCSRFGKIVGSVASAVAFTKKNEEKAAVLEDEFVVANFGQLLKQKRESLGMKQEEFAQKIAVKESMLHKMETGALVPSIGDARRMEKILGIRLVEMVEVTESAVPQAKKDQLTLGDMIKIKKK